VGHRPWFYGQREAGLSNAPAADAAVAGEDAETSVSLPAAIGVRLHAATNSRTMTTRVNSAIVTPTRKADAVSEDVRWISGIAGLRENTRCPRVVPRPS